MLVVTAVLLPLFFTLVMSGLENLVEPLDWRARGVNVGWDLCVLAFGVAGGVFSNPIVISAFTPQKDIPLAFASVGISLGAAVAIAHLRRRNAITGWFALCSLALGGAALGFPSYMIWGK